MPSSVERTLIVRPVGVLLSAFRLVDRCALSPTFWAVDAAVCTDVELKAVTSIQY